ncbi:hypothetical protein [Streptomyces sp. NBC_01565]|uniref:hypothetical protein n=1 Tax=unclassified Streptomyces TaxID=2593676 RepID=UPI002254A20D|nr:hypothetical protein [Streptomyces sp. NBC_01565]MCX4546344.1 hypothetical protein [Streptomyces sp. NBC_01565]
MDTSVILPAVIAAALVIRTAVAELRAPGSARAAWAFARDPAAAAAAVVVLAAVMVAAGTWTAAAWGLVAAVLTGHLTHQARKGDR